MTQVNSMQSQGPEMEKMEAELSERWLGEKDSGRHRWLCRWRKGGTSQGMQAASRS